MPVTVRIPTPLRAVAKGNADVQAKGDTVEDVIGDLERQFPGLRERLVDEAGELRRFIEFQTLAPIEFRISNLANTSVSIRILRILKRGSNGISRTN